MKKINQRQLDKLIEASQQAIEFAVVGAGDFPTDMLRYDKCWPASEHNSLLVGGFGDTRRVELRGLKMPTDARWRSFNWKVVAVNGERVA